MDPISRSGPPSKKRITIPKSSRRVFIENNTDTLLILTVQISGIAKIIVPVKPGKYKFCLCSEFIDHFLEKRLINVIVSWDNKKDKLISKHINNSTYFQLNNDSEFKSIAFQRYYNLLNVILVNYRNKKEKYYELCKNNCKL